MLRIGKFNKEICKNFFKIFFPSVEFLQKQTAKNTSACVLVVLNQASKTASSPPLSPNIEHLLCSFSEEKQKGLRALIQSGDFSEGKVIKLLTAQLPLFVRVELAIKSVARFSPGTKDIDIYCHPQGEFHMYKLPESLFLFLLLKDLDEKTNGEAKEVYFSHDTDAKLKISRQLVFEQGLKINYLSSEYEKLNHFLGSSLTLGDRLLLATRAAENLGNNPEKIIEFCKNEKGLRAFGLPESDPGLLRVLTRLDEKTDGKASEAYFKN